MLHVVGVNVCFNSSRHKTKNFPRISRIFSYNLANISANRYKGLLGACCLQGAVELGFHRHAEPSLVWSGMFSAISPRKSFVVAASVLS